MSAVAENELVLRDLALENFRAIRQDLDKARADFPEIWTNLANIRQHMSGFLASDVARESMIATIQTRLERIERRLDISDS